MMSHHAESPSHKKLLMLMIGALGVVFGDIGTSPLYALKVAVEAAGSKTPAEIAVAIIAEMTAVRRGVRFEQSGGAVAAPASTDPFACSR